MCKKIIMFITLMAVLVVMVTPTSIVHAATVTTYSGPSGILSSGHFQTRIYDGSAWKDSFMYYVDGDDGRGTYRYISYTNFEMGSGSITVEISNLQGNINSCTIRPQKYNITPIINGNKVTFTLDQPRKVEVEINGSSTDLCYIFANAFDGGQPQGTTYYYGPGVHDVGIVEMNSNEKVYVAGGAYVKGVFKFKDGTSGQQILGYGIISGENQKGVGADWSNMNGTKKNADWSFVNSSGQTIQNVTFIKPADPFLVWLVNGSLVDNVKFISHPDNGKASVGGDGGISIYGKTQAFTLQNCFAFTADDCYKFEYNDYNGCIIKDSTVATVAGSPLGGIWNDVLGSNTRGVSIQDCDIIQTADGNYGNNEGAIYAMPPNQYGTHGSVFDLVFKNITIENDNTPFNRLFGFNATDKGEIYNIIFENVQVNKSPGYKSNLWGYDANHKVRDITFNNVKINGDLLTDNNKGSYLDINSYAGNFVFKDTISGTRVDDGDASISYGGSWTQENISSSYVGSDRYTNIGNNYAQFNFNGTSIKWIARQNSYCGKADVYIDGVKDATVDTYNSSEIYQQAVYSKTGLSPGNHTIKVVATGQNGAGGFAYVVVDSFEYFGASSYSTVNDNDTSLIYGGSWTAYGPNLDYISSDCHYSTVSDYYCQYTFVGTDIIWVAQKTMNRGQADVYIDNVFDATIDCYNPVKQIQQEIYTKTGLSSGTHTIKIVVKGTKNSNSSGYIVDIDALKYK